MRKPIIAAMAALAMSAAAAPAAMAARNPSPTGTGQPGAFVGTSCGSGNATSQPAGFSTTGFATAEGVYANPGTTPSPSTHPVSEYDIACYQQTQNGH